MRSPCRRTGFSAVFTNLRTGEPCDNENALLATILADATNLGLTRMAAASQGVTRDQLIWIADAYIRPETYKAALARIINAHHTLPIAAIWGDGTTSSSDGQFFRSAKRGDAAGEINARYGHDPGVSLYGVTGRFVQNCTLGGKPSEIRGFHKRSFAHGFLSEWQILGIFLSKSSFKTDPKGKCDLKGSLACNFEQIVL